ncbi:hypothetical protein L226DRAFT_539851 [Lentinus tigrinus ALCF2SS1-7]|uniref:Uncharacterized protein n=1 Tax=Lentinus tigrinus ALCF2SS1-6 TaxID=1328759 RepID=A0A5C2RW01_9APHY|nr:hypothetical protein L227DRAFT_580459 [Lentinus tigrinus ALCF2SS1-6]RPD69327.1 hypothetical protein L226DRAFT_539851 [Lentinus tigrinus ALCF2SS1-7]
MPAIPQVLLSLPAEVTVPTFSFPAEIELPSGIDWERIRELFAALLRDINAAAHTGLTWVKEHPEQVKMAGLVVAAVVVICLTLYALVPAICTLLGAVVQLVWGVLELLHWLIMLPIKLVLNLVARILGALLQCVGFTSGGVRSFSLAARGQSFFYGATTGGYFSLAQSAGARRR